MDVLMLSRLQFAGATLFHFLFVPLTLGLSILLAIMETKYARTGDETYLRMTKFWGKIFIINFVVGVVTGITLEFQFGTNWSRYSSFVGDIFGSLLAIEATAAFFLESTFVASGSSDGKNFPQSPCCTDVVDSRRFKPFGCMDTDCQFLDAASGRVCDSKRPRRIAKLRSRCL